MVLPERSWPYGQGDCFLSKQARFKPSKIPSFLASSVLYVIRKPDLVKSEALEQLWKTLVRQKPILATASSLALSNCRIGNEINLRLYKIENPESFGPPSGIRNSFSIRILWKPFSMMRCNDGNGIIGNFSIFLHIFIFSPQKQVRAFF